MNIDCIKAMRAHGWEFNYSNSTGYIGAKHPNGGQQSICEMTIRGNSDGFGKAIVELLNGVNDED